MGFASPLDGFPERRAAELLRQEEEARVVREPQPRELGHAIAGTRNALTRRRWRYAVLHHLGNKRNGERRSGAAEQPNEIIIKRE